MSERERFLFRLFAIIIFAVSGLYFVYTAMIHGLPNILKFLKSATFYDYINVAAVVYSSGLYVVAAKHAAWPLFKRISMVVFPICVLILLVRISEEFHLQGVSLAMIISYAIISCHRFVKATTDQPHSR